MMSWLWQQIVDTVTILVLLSLHLQFATWAAVAPEFSCFLSVTNWSCVVFFTADIQIIVNLHPHF